MSCPFLLHIWADGEYTVVYLDIEATRAKKFLWFADPTLSEEPLNARFFVAKYNMMSSSL